MIKKIVSEANFRSSENPKIELQPFDKIPFNRRYVRDQERWGFVSDQLQVEQCSSDFYERIGLMDKEVASKLLSLNHVSSLIYGFDSLLRFGSVFDSNVHCLAEYSILNPIKLKNWDNAFILTPNEINEIRRCLEGSRFRVLEFTYPVGPNQEIHEMELVNIDLADKIISDNQTVFTD